MSTSKIIVPDTSPLITFYAREANRMPKGTPIPEVAKTVKEICDIVEQRANGVPLEEILPGTSYEKADYEPQVTDGSHPVRAFDDLGLAQQQER